MFGEFPVNEMVVSLRDPVVIILMTILQFEGLLCYNSTERERERGGESTKNNMTPHSHTHTYIYEIRLIWHDVCCLITSCNNFSGMDTHLNTAHRAWNWSSHWEFLHRLTLSLSTRIGVFTPLFRETVLWVLNRPSFGTSVPFFGDHACDHRF